VTSIAFAPDGQSLISSGFEGMVRRWSLSPLQADSELLADHGDRLFSVAISPNGRWLAVGAYASEVLIADLTESIPSFSVRGNRGGRVHTVAFSPDSRFLVTGSDWRLRIIDLEQPDAEETRLLGHRDAVRAVVFSPDGRLLASAGSDGIIRLWDMAQIEAEPTLLSGAGGWIWTLAFSPDGQTLASGSGDGRIRLWNLATPKDHPVILQGHQRRVYSLVFSPDGRTLASGGQDGTVRLWNVAGASLADAVCESVRRDLSEAEWQVVAGDVAFEPTCRDLPRGAMGGVPTITPSLATPANATPVIPAPLARYVPDTLVLPQGQNFRISSQYALDLDGSAARFANPVEARDRLLSWGWEMNGSRVLSAEDPPENAVGWVEVSIHRFATAQGAEAALPYFAAARREGLQYESVDLGRFGEQSEAMTGEADNGNEVTIYARKGNLLVRVSGITPIGDPSEDVKAVLGTILAS
jgi:hypothetical protein